MSNIQLFDFETTPLRVIRKENDEIWFVAKEFCESIGIKNHRQSISKLDQDERASLLHHGSPLSIISESGAYFLAIKSNKDKAKKFRKWVTSVVLTSIRKTGSFSIEQGAEWKSARIEGKSVRKLSTDITQIFIQYARDRGSQSPETYYQNFSKMVNKALLDFIVKPQNLRDLLNVVQLQQIAVAETIIAKTLIECMRLQLPYKEIYQIAKRKIDEYSSMVSKSKLGQSEKQTLNLEFTT